MTKNKEVIAVTEATWASLKQVCKKAEHPGMRSIASEGGRGSVWMLSRATKAASRRWCLFMSNVARSAGLRSTAALRMMPW